jgi:hypothetical protein
MSVIKVTPAQRVSIYCAALRGVMMVKWTVGDVRVTTTDGYARIAMELTKESVKRLECGE